MKLRLGYVPEHFSSPLLQLGRSEWGQAHIELVPQPSGTGQMLTSLQPGPEQKIDVSVALTEALIAGIAKGRTDYTLVGSYVRSSLNWAVITGTSPHAARYNSIKDLRGAPIGISRIGSGSQLMASVMALQQGWTDKDGEVEPIEFKVLDTFANLRRGVNEPVASEGAPAPTDIKAQCIPDEFKAAAQAYVAKHATTGKGSLGPAVYAHGWEWNEAKSAGGAPPAGQLRRTFQHKDGSSLFSVTQSIVHSPTWGVPVLYLSAVDGDGSPLSLEQLQSTSLLKPSVSQASSSPASFPRLGLGDHPITGLPTPFLHPCETSTWLSLLSQLGSPQPSSASYLEAFLAFASTGAELRVGGDVKEGDDSMLPPPQTAAFMWEWFTTKPFSDGGEVRFIGSVPTPWPSWTIAASIGTTQSSPEQREALDELLRRIQESIASFTSPENIGIEGGKSLSETPSGAFIREEFSYEPADIDAWLGAVRWAGDPRPDPAEVKVKPRKTDAKTVSREVLLSTLDTLGKAGVVKQPKEGWKPVAFVQEERLVD